MRHLRLVNELGTFDYVSEGDTFNIAPLGHVALTELVTGSRPSVPVALRGLLQVDEQGEPQRDKDRVNATLDWAPDGGVDFFGLTIGGWVPPILGSGRVALLDRNMVAELRAMPVPAEGDAPPAVGSPGWLYRAFADSCIEVSPAVHLMEGNMRRAPTLEEMAVEMQTLVGELKTRMPKAELHELGPVELKALHEVVVEREAVRQRETAFLTQVAPRLAEPVATAARRRVEQEVLQSAERNGLGRLSLVVLAALSCIHENSSHGRSKVYRVGRAVLKPKKNYSEGNAYNALADLSALELLVNTASVLQDYRGVLFTQDVGLAAFWSALEVSAPTAESTGPGRVRASVTMELSEALLPSLSESERVELKERLR